MFFILNRVQGFRNEILVDEFFFFFIRISVNKNTACISGGIFFFPLLLSLLLFSFSTKEKAHYTFNGERPSLLIKWNCRPYLYVSGSRCVHSTDLFDDIRQTENKIVI